MKRKRYKLEVLIDGKWFLFKDWNDFFSFAVKNIEKAGKAEAFYTN